MSDRGHPVAIHLIEKRGFIHPIAESAGEYTSGFWAVSPKTAKRLHGGDIYFHRSRKDPSFLGGQIIDSRPARLDEYPKPNRIVFRFKAEPGHSGVVTDAAGWGQEKKFVW